MLIVHNGKSRSEVPKIKFIPFRLYPEPEDHTACRPIGWNDIGEHICSLPRDILLDLCDETCIRTFRRNDLPHGPYEENYSHLKYEPLEIYGDPEYVAFRSQHRIYVFAFDPHGMKSD